MTQSIASGVIAPTSPSASLKWSCVTAVLTVLPGGTLIGRRDGFVPVSDANRWSVASTMRELDVTFASGESGRYWFREVIPTCDGVVTLGKLLQTLGRSDAHLSEVIARRQAFDRLK